MSMHDWAKHEVEIAKRQENGFTYGEMCYDSALKAYLSLCEDDHSGMSFSFTAGILKRLLDAYPLTPIEDDETWGDSDQCSRMPSLFREHDDTTGDIYYSDVDRVVCYEEGSDVPFGVGLIRKYIDKRYPIKMPYYPTGKFIVTIRRFSTVGDRDSFDTIQIIRIKLPDGRSFYPDAAWKEIENGDFIEISESECLDRYLGISRCNQTEFWK